MSLFDGNLPLPGTDPFIGTAKQTNRLKAFYRVIVAGTDVTDKLRPHLQSIRVIDDSAPHCTIEIDDRDAKLPIPPRGSSVTVHMGWTTESNMVVFNGKTYDLEYQAARKQGGRKMYVHALGMSWDSKAKEPQQLIESGQSGGESPIPFTDFAQKSAKNAGISGFDVAGQYASKMQKTWEQNGASFLQKMGGLARDWGAGFRVGEGNKAEMVVPGSRGSCIARWGDNLIQLRVRPFASRSTWGGGAQQYYDPAKAVWGMAQQAFGKAFPFGGGAGGGSDVMYSLPNPASNSQEASQDNAGSGERASYEPGFGRILINGEPSAKWMGRVQVIGVRPGVDGQYIIYSAEHTAARGQGYITWLEVDVDAGASGSSNVGAGYDPQAGPG